MAVTVAAGQNGVTAHPVGANGTDTVTFAAAYPSAVEVTTVSGGPVTVRLGDSPSPTVVAVGQTRQIDARNAAQPLRVRLAAASAATVTVLGRDGDRYIADPAPTTPATPRTASGSLRVWTQGGLVPAATAGTNGPAATCNPSPGMTGLLAVLLARVVYAGTFGTTETVTVTFTATFSDATTASGTSTGTAPGTQTVGATGLVAMAKDGLYVRSISVAARSSIAASAVTATVDVLALQV